MTSYDQWKLQTPEEAYPPDGRCAKCGGDIWNHSSRKFGYERVCEYCYDELQNEACEAEADLDD